MSSLFYQRFIPEACSICESGSAVFFCSAEICFLCGSTKPLSSQILAPVATATCLLLSPIWDEEEEERRVLQRCSRDRWGSQTEGGWIQAIRKKQIPHNTQTPDVTTEHWTPCCPTTPETIKMYSFIRWDKALVRFSPQCRKHTSVSADALRPKKDTYLSWYSLSRADGMSACYCMLRSGVHS